MRGGDTPPMARSPRRIAGVVIATLLPMVAFAAFAVFSALAAFRAEDNARLMAAARTLGAAVDAQFGAAIAGLRVFAHSRSLDDAATAQELLAAFRDYGIEPGVAIVLVGPPEAASPVIGSGFGALIMPPALGQDIAAALRDTAARVFASGEPVVSDLVTAVPQLGPFVAAVVPVIRAGEVRHALALILDPAALHKLLHLQRLDDGVRAAIGDSRMRLLAHSNDPEGRRVGLVAPGWMIAAMQGRPQGIIVGPSDEAPGDNRRKAVYAFTRPTVAPGWTLGVAEEMGQLWTDAWRAMRWAVAGGAALGLGLALAVWICRRDALRDAQREADLLRAGRAEVQRLLGGMPAVIFHRDMRRDGSSRLLYRGGDFEGVTGWPATDLTSDDAVRRHTYPGDPQNRLAELAEPLWRDGQVRFEWRVLQPDGGVRWMSTLVRVISRHGDNRMEVVGYSINVTPEHEAKARALSAARLASLGEMAAGLAHELKQPLQSMTLAADIAVLAVARQDHEEVLRRLATIIGQAQRASDLIERVRRSARGGANQGATEDVDLAVAVEGALLLTGSVLADAGVKVEVALGEPSPIVRGEAAPLEQVLANLLLNAADALAQQPIGAPRWIRIASERDADGMLRITIADNGGGIAPEILARIFEPFVTTKGPDKGTGLGLSLCHGLVTGMGGRIEARNEPAGAVFTLILADASTHQQG